LTPAQQLVVAEAVRFAERIVSRFERKYGHIIEFRGETHLKIVREVASFDPSRSSLATWARVEAQYACLDALRRDSAAHARHKGRGKGRKICSLNTMLGDGEAGLLNGRLEDPHDDIAGVDERDEIEWLLSLAPPNARETIYRVDVMGESNVGLARSLGITDVALHSRRKAGLAKIRKAIEDRRRIRGTATQAEAG
jgi:RNA polymerase sigma factor (sigma-70 family)